MKRPQNEPQWSAARLAEAQSLTHLGYFEFDIPNDTVWWSDEIYRTLGLEPQSLDLTYELFKEFLRPDEIPRMEKILSEGMANGLPFSYGYWMVRPDGGERYFETEGEFILDDKGEPIRLVGTVLEATDRKNAEADLRKSEYLLAEAQELAHLGNWEYETGKETLHWSDETYRLLGVEPETLDPTIEKFLDLVHPDDRALASAEIEKSVTGAVPLSFEHRVVRPDGTERILQERGRVVCDENGLVKRMFGTAQDVTETRRIERELKRANDELESRVEQRTKELSATLETLIEGVITIDDQGVIEAFNKSAEVLFGYAAEEIIGQNVACLMTGQDSANHDQNIGNYLKTGHAKIIGIGREVKAKRKDGTVFPMRLGIGEMEIDGRRKFVGTVHDVTDRRMVEEELAAQTRLLRRAERSARVGHFRRPLQGGPLYWSDETYRIFGVNKETFIPTRETAFALLHPDDVEQYAKLADAAAAKGDSFEMDMRVVRPSGEVRHIRLEAETEVSEADEPIASFGVIIDITDIRAAEADLRQREGELSTITRLSPTGIFRADKSGRATYVNDRWNEIMGIVGAGDPFEVWRQAVHPDDREAAFEHWQTSISQGIPYAGEFRVVWPDGSVKSTYSEATPERNSDGELVGYVGFSMDVTERKLAEAALSKSEKDLRNITESSPVGIYRSDPAGYLTYVNDRWREIMGLPGDAALSDGWINSMHPDDREPTIEIWQNFVNGHEELYEVDCRIIRPDGSVAWLISQAARDYGEGGELVGYVGTLTDVTDLHETMSALEQSEYNYQTLARFSPVGIFRMNADRLVRYTNSRWWEIMGHDPETDSEDDWPQWLHADDRDHMLAEWNNATTDGQTFRGEFRIVTSCGKTRWILGQTGPEKDPNGRHVGYVGSVIDITEQKDAELALAESENRFAMAMRGANDGLWDWDLESEYVYYSPRWMEMLGYQIGELPNSSEAWSTLLHPDDQPRVERFLTNCLEGEAKSTEVEIRLRHKDGQYVDILSRAFPVLGEGNAPVRIVGTNSDISVRKRVETQLLDAKISAEEAREQAESANRAKSDFLSSMSHELRTPMNAVLGFAQLLEQDQLKLSEDHKSYVDEILRSGHHMMELINDVLDLAKVESGNISLDMTTQEPKPLIESCVKMIGSSAQNENLSIRCTFPEGELPSINVDTVCFRQVLLNLLSNAVKYNKPGGHVSIECDLDTDGMFRVSIADTGEGIPAEKLHQVFEPFDRLGYEESNVAGTGIGLTVTKQLVEAMGAR